MAASIKYIYQPVLRAFFVILFSIASFCAGEAKGEEAACNDCFPRFALKTNLLHDLVLTPDIGIEAMVAKRFSLSLSGVYAWWSNDSKHRYWRIRGGVMEMRVWFGDRRRERALTGHHIGFYGSVHDYDFEFGGKGWQSPDATYGVGVAYGYSVPLNSRLNLDFGIRAGYSAGNVIRYKPQCGTYVCTERSFHRYFGLMGLDISLVWFPGTGDRNKPNYGL